MSHMMADLDAVLTSVLGALAAVSLAFLITIGLVELRFSARARRGIHEIERFLNHSSSWR